MELQDSYERILAGLPEDAEVLDVGGWSRPFWRATWVIDLQPYETRGLYGRSLAAVDDQAGPERFDAGTWVQRDVCDREPWPFADDQFDFAVCAQTLEDLRDPVWVCAELSRIARAGYIEVPSRLQEQSRGVNGPWVGYSHHRWLIDVVDGRIEFVHKPAFLQARPSCSFPPRLAAAFAPHERWQAVWWDGAVDARERMFLEPRELDAYVEDFVRTESKRRAAREPIERAKRIADRARRRLRG